MTLTIYQISNTEKNNYLSDFQSTTLSLHLGLMKYILRIQKTSKTFLLYSIILLVVILNYSSKGERIPKPAAYYGKRRHL